MRQSGLQLQREVDYVLLPQLFSAQEIELFALPCKTKPAHVAAEVAF
ncbi:MAG: hypothetical protein KF760_06275 [Candidatus Eremiobacteraeota bacterium]|nr:hypothetical protein [Candidatus Eremiobacteraeota bacterium]MCW5866136.1 hypothetical protein [Candidatus Eremiobacteraeota bacterium]